MTEGAIVRSPVSRLAASVLTAALSAFSTDANAQLDAASPRPTDAGQDEQAPAEEPRITLPGGFALELHGFFRIRGNGNANFDLKDEDRRDDFIRFIDARAYIDIRVEKGPFAIVSSVDLAGNEFNDGAILGNDRPPLGPGGLRELELRVRQLGFE